MKSIAHQLASYAMYHRDPRNKASHLIGVPMITFAILLAFSWIRPCILGFEIPFAVPFSLAVLAYYFLLDTMLACTMVVVMLPTLHYANQAALLPWSSSMALFLVLFVVGWIFQLIGHAFEGKRPALVDNFFQIFMAPLFVTAEIYFLLGLRRDLKRRVEELLVME